MEMVDRHIPSSFPLGLRVLLVDDNPTCLEIMRKKLQEECKYEGKYCCVANAMNFSVFSLTVLRILGNPGQLYVRLIIAKIDCKGSFLGFMIS